MKKGDVVTITDGSYTKSVVAGKLVGESLNYRDEKGKHYIVIETECSFPLELGFSRQPDDYRNDTVIQAVKSGKVVFIHRRFLCPAIKPIREVTMAEVCTQFGQEVKIRKD